MRAQVKECAEKLAAAQTELVYRSVRLCFPLQFISLAHSFLSFCCLLCFLCFLCFLVLLCLLCSANEHNAKLQPVSAMKSAIESAVKTFDQSMSNLQYAPSCCCSLFALFLVFLLCCLFWCCCCGVVLLLVVVVSHRLLLFLIVCCVVVSVVVCSSRVFMFVVVCRCAVRWRASLCTTRATSTRWSAN